MGSREEGGVPRRWPAGGRAWGRWWRKDGLEECRVRCGAGWAERCLWESRSRGGLGIYGAAEKPGAFGAREGNADFVFVKP
jgi:hypothetical protein